jgi:hypothetical protein
LTQWRVDGVSLFSFRAKKNEGVIERSIWFIQPHLVFILLLVYLHCSLKMMEGLDILNAYMNQLVTLVRQQRGKGKDSQ